MGFHLIWIVFFGFTIYYRKNPMLFQYFISSGANLPDEPKKLLVGISISLFLKEENVYLHIIM